MSEYILQMAGITKDFPGVKALDNVTFSVKPGEIHALVGENGAGKSTLMKILSGVYPGGTYIGSIIIDGAEVKFRDTRQSERAGIAIIYQELALVKELSVAENICLGDEIATAGIIDWDKSFAKAEQVLKKVGLSINPTFPISYLGVGEQQLVAIAKALSKEARILVLDEPTAALSEGESAKLLKILKDLRAGGVTCIYISHRLKEVFEIADRITVLRDGKTVATHDRKDLDENKLISLMVGREVTNIYPRKPRAPGDVILEVKDWTVYDPNINKTIADVNFKLRRGEILGMAGLIGAGRTELVMSFFRFWGRKTNGKMFLEGKEVDPKDAGSTIAAGISLASEDRKRYGLVLDEDVCRNISLASLERISKYEIVNALEEIRSAEHYSKELRIKTPSIEQKAGNLSGGNQQKVVLGKWLMTMPKVLILDEPTRGIDVGAKVEIYNIINELVDKGVAVIVISSDLSEVLGICDRILVMHEGRFTGELPIKEATQEKIMHYATGGK
ncbi:MAG: xylose ABC transporter ATP-binding protein [Candidatus Omnitrophica bacterium]|nr:xylose ABC transporter ATP-binding protein [Candidatus Omnitrophota bacterium]